MKTRGLRKFSIVSSTRPVVEPRNDGDGEEMFYDINSSIGWPIIANTYDHGRHSLDLLTPPASPSRFIFHATPSPTMATTQTVSFKRCITSPASLLASNNVVGSLKRWKERRREKFKAKVHDTGSLSAQSAPILDNSFGYASSSEDLFDHREYHSREVSSSINSTISIDSEIDPNLSPPWRSTSPLTPSSEPFASPLRHPRNFAVLRNTLAWEQGIVENSESPLKATPASKLFKNQYPRRVLPPPVPPPSELLPPLPIISSRETSGELMTVYVHPKSTQATALSCHSSLTQWKRELQKQSVTLQQEKCLDEEQPSRQNSNRNPQPWAHGSHALSQRPEEIGGSETPSTVTPSKLTPRTEALNDLNLEDNHNRLSILVPPFPSPPSRLGSAQSGHRLTRLRSCESSSNSRSSLRSFYSAASHWQQNDWREAV